MKAKDALKACQDIMASLRKHGLDFNYRNQKGETALHLAAASGDTEVFDVPDYKPDINAQSNDGMTPLMMAIFTQPRNAPINNNGSVTINYGTPQVKQYTARAFIVMTLLKQGADLTLKNKAGKTAMDLARENGNAEILALLQHPPPKPTPPIKDGGKYSS
jgi:ankyrin repeat protein